MNEHDQYVTAISEILLPFLNADDRDSGPVADNFISKFAIKDIKAQSVVRIVLMTLERILDEADYNPDIQEMAEQSLGMSLNILADIAIDDWSRLEERLK